MLQDEMQAWFNDEPSTLDDMREKDEPSPYGERLQWAIDNQSRPVGVTELAAAAGVSYQAIRAVLKGGAGGTKALSAETHVRAARFLGVDSFWLATGEGSPELQTDKKWSELSPLARASALTMDHLRNDEPRQEVIYSQLLRLVADPAVSPPSSPGVPAKSAPAASPKRKRDRHR